MFWATVLCCKWPNIKPKTRHLVSLLMAYSVSLTVKEDQSVCISSKVHLGTWDTVWYCSLHSSTGAFHAESLNIVGGLT